MKDMGNNVKKYYVLVDTDVIIDVLTKRPEYTEAEQILFSLIENKKVKGFLAAHSFTNMFYIFRKYIPSEQRRQMLLSLFDCFSVSGLDADKIISALERDSFKDFEDCLQDECAQAVHADFIITRNTGDYVTSSVKAITPGDFIKFVG